MFVKEDVIIPHNVTFYDLMVRCGHALTLTPGVEWACR